MRWFAPILAAFVLIVAHPAQGGDQEGCLLCHRHALRVPDNGTSRSLKVRDAPGSAHDTLFCSDCHPDARNAPHPVRPGIAQCIGECHGAGSGTTSIHRIAAYGGLGEKHRRLVPGGSTCPICHRAGDARGDRIAAQRRCAECHRKEKRTAMSGPHGRRGGGASFCTECHPPHRAAKTDGDQWTSVCAVPRCHPGASTRVLRLADHRVPGEAGAAKIALFLLPVVAAWRIAVAVTPRDPGRGVRS